MADPLEPDVAGPADAPGTADVARRRPPLTARTIGICVCIALLGALLAGFVAAQVTGSDGDGGLASEGRLTPTSAKIDSTKLLATPLLTVAGKKTTLAPMLQTKPVLVNLWSQSCDPCTAEMPLLEEVHQSDDRVDIVGVDTQDRIDLAKQMAKQTGITYPWLQDPKDDFLYEAKAVGLPHTVLLSASGRVLASKTGEFKSVDEIRSWLTKNLR